MKFRKLPRDDLGASWGSPGVSCGVSWGALACSGGSLSGSLGCFGCLMGCPGWLSSCACVLPWQNEAKLEANNTKMNTQCIKMKQKMDKCEHVTGYGGDM